MLGPDWGTKAVERLAQSEAAAKLIRLRPGGVALRSHNAVTSPKSEALLTQLETYIVGLKLVQVGAGEMALDLNLPVQAVETTIESGLDSGRLVEIERGFVVAASSLQALVNDIGQLDTGHGFGVGEFKTFTNLTRKSAIPILEWLDHNRHTTRDGDRRVLNKD